MLIYSTYLVLYTSGRPRSPFGFNKGTEKRFRVYTVGTPGLMATKTEKKTKKEKKNWYS